MLAGNTVSLMAVEPTTEGVNLATSRASDWNPYTQNHDVVITIPEGFDENIIHINAFEDVPTVTAEPGDSMRINVKVVNNSGTEYHYVDQSVNLYTLDLNPENEEQHVYRALNTPLKSIGVTGEPTDDKVAEALLKEKYGSSEMDPSEVCAEYLDDFYLNYYNTTFKDTDEPVAETLLDVNTAYRFVIFNSNLQYRDWNKEWVELRGDEMGLRPDEVAPTREVNDEVQKLNHLHAYTDLVKVNGVGVLGYQKGTEAYAGLNNMLNTSLFAEEGMTFNKFMNGAANNCYQDHIFYTGLHFTLVKDGVTIEEKTSEPDLEKKITSGEDIIIDENGDYATVDASGKVQFTLTSHVGEDLAEVIKPKEAVDPGIAPGELPLDQFDYGTYSFTFVDHMDPELILDEGSFVLTVNGKNVELKPEDIVISTTTEGIYAGRTQIRVSVDLVQLFKDGYFTYDEFGTAPIVLTYMADLKDKDNIIPGKMYNTAWVEYQDKKTEPDDVDVDTFGLKIFKYDQTTNKGLQGAEFKLVRVNEDGTEEVIEEKLVSDADGNIVVKGLKEGIYKLYETKAPTGYTKSDKPLTIIVNAENDDESYYVGTQFANAPEVHTGGEGTTMFTTVGGALILAGAAWLVITKRRSAEAE